MHIIFSLLIILLYLKPTIETCSSFSCDPHSQDPNPTHFPFRVIRNQSTQCGYPGFELSCYNSQRILKLPSNHLNPFVVFAIDYSDQLIWLTDPNSCIPKRVMDLNLTGSPYILGPTATKYSFFNCSETVKDTNTLPVGSSVISCMSGANFTVVSSFEKESKEKIEKEWKCKIIKTIKAPFWWPEFGYGYYPVDMSNVFLQLSWNVPNCGDCEIRGGSCGFVPDSGREVGCYVSNNNGGLPKIAEIGVILGVGIPGIICMVALTFYISSRFRRRNNNQHHANSESSPAIFPQPIIITLGLDRPTIESYPKTILGESKRLPKPSDGTCPICLSEYQPKETLRSIPECNHYFHAECIDEWLQMNATCPLCRNSPQISSSTMPLQNS